MEKKVHTLLDNDGIPLVIMIHDRSQLLDIVATHRHKKVRLDAEYTKTFAYIYDITGNGYRSGLQCQGFGSLLVNTLIQVLRSKLPAPAVVMGEISDQGDPDDSVLLEQCRMVRENFWRSFDFDVLPGKHGYPMIRANLNDLKTKRAKLVLDRYPAYVPINEFSPLAGGL